MMLKRHHQYSCWPIVKCIILFQIVFYLLAGEAAAGTLYYFTSDPGDYIGGGETKFYNLSDSTFTPISEA